MRRLFLVSALLLPMAAAAQGIVFDLPTLTYPAHADPVPVGQACTQANALAMVCTAPAG